MPYQDEDELPIIGNPNRNQLARLMSMYGLGGNLSMSLPLSMPDDETGSEDDEGQSVMMHGGASSGNDSAAEALDEQGYMGAGGSSSPLNVTPLRDRVAGLGRPPSKTDQILGLISDIAAGGLAGARTPQARGGLALRGGGVSPGLAATLGGFAGIQAGEANSRAREDRRRVLDTLDFGRAEKLYNADVNLEKARAMETRLGAQSKAMAGYYGGQGKLAEAKAEQMLKDIKNGTIRLDPGQQLYARNPESGQMELIEATSPEAKMIKEALALTTVAQKYLPDADKEDIQYWVLSKIMGREIKSPRRLREEAKIKSDAEAQTAAGLKAAEDAKDKAQKALQRKVFDTLTRRYPNPVDTADALAYLRQAIDDKLAPEGTVFADVEKEMFDRERLWRSSQKKEPPPQSKSDIRKEASELHDEAVKDFADAIQGESHLSAQETLIKLYEGEYDDRLKKAGKRFGDFENYLIKNGKATPLTPEKIDQLKNTRERTKQKAADKEAERMKAEAAKGGPPVRKAAPGGYHWVFDPSTGQPHLERNQ